MTTPEHRAPEGGRLVSEMQERLARVLCLGDEMDPDEPVYETAEDGSTRLYGPCWWTYRERALSVMRAIFEPTTPMIEAGGNYVLQEGGIDPMHVDDRGPPYCIKGRETGSYELWRAMISAEISIAEGGKDNG